MSGDSLGKLFKVTNWGESHGPAVGCVVEGCPPGIELSEQDIQPYLDKRRPGQSQLVTQRNEADQVRILSGTVDGKTTGTAISLMIENSNSRSKDYSEFAKLYRPSHADFTYQQKYGIRDVAGGGRSSARTTAANVAAGAIAQKVLSEIGVEVLSWVETVGAIKSQLPIEQITESLVESNPVRCPDQNIAKEMEQKILEIRKQGDTIGGVVRCVVRNMPVGLGEPLFDKLEADLAKAMLSINASKGFEIGSGFDGTTMVGSEHNDIFYRDEDGAIKTHGNNSGGVQGGISNGMDLDFKVAFKPVATLMQKQKTVDLNGDEIEYQGRGRHDPCVLPRAVPIVDAMAALVLCDHLLRYRAYRA
ncbi:chorismate synthase [Aliikangiella coralliicola]|uniref:Chorismate synthase n=1 Tax=Aliikangiella coralliicola TaxID=2592383 RepID=A0A545U4Z6_9GAMM|nr:chorismate synthase [Aliikangiella coralliicola]TQV84551.1 chorismate synthase [Aliikangiella coralliicola]